MKDYAEISSFVWREDEKSSLEENFRNFLSSKSKMSPKSSPNFGNLSVTFSPNFVRNIECSATGGKLVSILPPKDDFRCFFLQQNNKFVKAISYPNNMVPNGVEFKGKPAIKITDVTDDNNNTDDVIILPTVQKNVQTTGTNTVPEKPERNPAPSQARFEKKPQPSRTEVPEKLTHAESKDSLVTQSLLNLTSYDGEEDDQVCGTLSKSHRCSYSNAVVVSH